MTDVMNGMFKKPGIWRRIIVVMLSAMLLLSLAACGNESTEQPAAPGEGEAETQLRQQLANEAVTEITITGNVHLNGPVEVSGNKTIQGDGKIKAVGTWANEAEYLLVIQPGAQIVLAQSLTVDANGKCGGIYVSEDASVRITEDTLVCNASAATANVLAAGSVEVAGGTLSGANGDSLSVIGNAVITGGKITGSGDGFAAVRVTGKLEQSGGEISGAYNNVYVEKDAAFVWNGGSNLDARNNGVYIAEGAQLNTTDASAVLKNAGAQGILLEGGATLDSITISGCNENQIKVEESATLVINDCTLSGSLGHGITNRGKLTMNGGDISGAASCGIVNTGELEVIKAGIRTNGNKGILVKNGGKLLIASEDVAISGNVVGIAIEENASADVSRAKINSNTLNNISCFGELYIHDIMMGGSGSNCIATNYGGHVVAKNMEIISTNGNNGIYNINGSLIELTDCIISGVKTNAIRNLDADLIGTNVTISNCAGGISSGDYIFGKAGSVKITNLTMSGITGSSVTTEAYSGGIIELTNAKLGPTGSNNLSVKGGHVILNDVVIDGNNWSFEGTTHGILMDNGGRITATNLTINDTKYSAIRNRGGYFEGTNVTMNNLGQHGISNASHGTTKAPGVVVIKNLKTYFVRGKNIDNNSKGGQVEIYDGYLCQTKDNSIANYNGTLIISGVKLEGTLTKWSDYLYGFMVTGGTVKATDITIGQTYGGAIRSKGGVFEGTNITGSGGLYFVRCSDGGNVNIHGAVAENYTEDNVLTESKAGTVTISNATFGVTGSNNISCKAGTVNLIDSKILGTTGTGAHGIYVTSAAFHGEGLTIENSQSGLRVNHANAVAELKDSTITSVRDDGVNLTGGSVVLEGVTVDTPKDCGIYANVGTVTGKNVVLDGVPGYGVYIGAKAGDISFDGLKVNQSGTAKTNVTISAEQSAYTGTVTVKNAILGVSKSNNVVLKAAQGNMILSNVEIQGTDGSATHAIYITNGTIVGDQLNLHGTVGAGLRIAGGETTVSNVKVSDTLGSAIQVSGGALTINGITTENIGSYNVDMYSNGNVTVNGYADGAASSLAVTDAEKNSLHVVAGNIALNNVNVLGTADGTAAVYVKNSTLSLVGGSVTGNVDNYGTLTLGNVYISGTVYSDSVIDFVGDKTPHTKEDPMKLDSADLSEAKVMVRTESAAIAAALAETFVAPNTDLPMEAKDNNIRIFLDPNTYVARVGSKKFITLKEAIEYAASVSTADSAATVQIIHDISLDGTITIPANANIIITDDGNARTLTRATTFNTKARGVLFDVSAGVRLTITSTGNDGDPRLTIDGNNTAITAESGNWAMLDILSGCTSVTIESGVRLINNSSTGAGGVIRMEPNSGTLNITGGLFANNKVTGNGAGVIYVRDGAVANINNAVFSNNSSTSDGGVLYVVKNAKLTTNNCHFANNSSGSAGGVLMVQSVVKGDVVLSNSTFTGNFANKGGVISVPTGCVVSVNNCTFTDNSCNSEGKDIRLGGATSKLYLSGKIVGYVHNQNKSTVNVEGVLSEGSRVELHWLVNDAARIPAVAVQFDSATAALANKSYLTLSVNNTETHHLQYTGSTAVLVEGSADVASVNGVKYESIQEAVNAAAAASTADKPATVVILRDVSISSTVTVPADANIIITDDGTARTLIRSEGGSWSATARGVLIDVKAGATLTLTGNLTLDGNKGVLAATDGNWALVNNFGHVNIGAGVTLQNNKSTGAGAAIRLESGSSLNITGGRFLNNEAAGNHGGAIYVVSGAKNVSIQNAHFEGNASGQHGGAICTPSGAVYDSLLIKNCSFVNNQSGKDSTANAYGGAISSYGAATIENCTFTNNSATYGGAITGGNGAAISIIGCTFTGNSSTQNGGAVNGAASATIHISGSTFTGNHATANGGAVSLANGSLTGSTLTGNTSDASGGAVNTNAAAAENFVITDCRITGNTAAYGGGIYGQTAAYLTIDGGTITGNTGTGGQGNNVQFAGAKTNKLLLKSTNTALVADIYFRAASSMKVSGTLMEGSEVTLHWHAIPTEAAVNFDNVSGATANRQFLKLSAELRETHHLDYSEGGAYAKLVSGKLLDVAVVNGVCYSDFMAAMTAAGEESAATGKVSTVVLLENVQTTETVTIPAGAHIVIKDDGNVRTISRSASFNTARGVMFDLINAGSSLTLISTSRSNGDCRLILDGANQSFYSGNCALVVTRAGAELTINAGVKLCNNYSGGAGAVIRVENGSGSKLTVNGGVFENNHSVSNNGGAINLLCTSTQSVIRNAVFSGNTAGVGGAIIIQANVTGLIENCSFNNNGGGTDGGAIYTYGTANVNNCSFTGNTANNSGAIHVNKTGTANVVGGTFTENRATKGYGGAASAWGGTLNVTGATFTGNTATESGGAVLGYKGGASVVNLTNCIFTNNSATKQGGALAAWESTNTVTNCTFTNNSGTLGGAIHMNNQTTSKLVVSGGTFTGNQATSGEGGAIYASVKSPQAQISGAAFNQNNSTAAGGAVFAGATYGMPISDCTFTGNTAPKGGAITVPTGSHVVLHNVTCSGNVGNSEGNDVRLGGATSKVTVSGKVVVAIHNQNTSTVYVTGTLSDGSTLACDWQVGMGRIPAVAIRFDSEEAAAASMPYISVGGICSSGGYGLKQSGATAVLYQIAAEANENIAEGEPAPADSNE